MLKNEIKKSIGKGRGKKPKSTRVDLGHESGWIYKKQIKKIMKSYFQHI